MGERFILLVGTHARTYGRDHVTVDKQHVTVDKQHVTVDKQHVRRSLYLRVARYCEVVMAQPEYT